MRAFIQATPAGIPKSHNFYIIRHGQTELNNRSALQGRSDHPLNEKGIAQAEAAETS